MDSLLIKLGLLFFGVFFATYFVFLTWSLLISSFENSAAESIIPTVAAVDDIDPKIEKELAKVLNLEDLPEDFTAKDPFLDRSGITGISNVQRGRVSSQLARAAGNPSQATSAAAPTDQAARTASNAADSAKGPSKRSEAVREMNTSDRYAIWAHSSIYGNFVGEPSPTIFSINDLVPVGVVDGGSGAEEVMFYSEAADRILSFPVGTRLHDGWIMEVIPEGVIFGSGDKAVTKRLKSWGRSVRTRNSQSISINTPTDESRTDLPETKQEIFAGGSN
ncbi:MAG: hypothetical protein OEM82_07735 [Acidobacteriota bacterium]|nr:hypothetical protein [Acidobacteriota bacterium]MDH3529493.1 hypothetical protein [Acidobacteriota bacterium]